MQNRKDTRSTMEILLKVIQLALNNQKGNLGTIPFTIEYKKTLNLVKDISNINSKNNKVSLKEITEDLSKWQDIYGHDLENLI